MRVLIVDDDADFAEIVRIGLERHEIESAIALEGAAALQALTDAPGGHFDAILLDVEMPGMSGWDLLYDLRSTGREIPVIFVTGLAATDEKVRGLGLGADDYVTKPIEIDELHARIMAVLRRRENVAPLEWGTLRLDLMLRRVLRGADTVELSPREFDLLLCLVRAKGEIISREHLLSEVWGLDFDPGTNVLDVHIGRLRKKLDRTGPPLIHNERGQGYRIEARQDKPST